MLENIIVFLNTHNGIANNILVILSIISMLVGAIIGVIKIIKKSDSKKQIPEPKDRATYFNMPDKKYECLGRDDSLKEVYKKIRGEEDELFPGNHIYITGREGIGKTLLCETLCLKKLRSAKIYIGWIKCNGKQSIFEIISKAFNKDLRFHNKNKKDILSAFKELSDPCVLFIDQIDQYTPTLLEEIDELAKCPNITLVASGLLKEIKFINDRICLLPLPENIIKNIFEHKSDEKIENMTPEDQHDVEDIFSGYVKGNPFLASAFALAKVQNNKTWRDVKETMNGFEGDPEFENYITNILKRLYRIPDLREDDKTTLEKLIVFSSLKFTKMIFELCNIPKDCIDRLCNTHWLEQVDNVFYELDSDHKVILRKILSYEEILKKVIISISDYFKGWEIEENRGFEDISPYIEDILKEVKRYIPQIIEEPGLFAQFAYNISLRYENIRKYERSLEWIRYCNPSDNDKQLMYDKVVLECLIGWHLLNPQPNLSEIEEIKKNYSNAREKAKMLENSDAKQKYLKEEYCGFLNSVNLYDEAKLICKEYFEKTGFSFDDELSIAMFYRYLYAAKRSDDQELLHLLVATEIIDRLILKQNPYITLAWTFGELIGVYENLDNMEAADKCKRKMVILINRIKCFFHDDIKFFIDISEDEFMDYMHYDDELEKSLNEAIEIEDSNALYLEGRYKEKNDNLDVAFSLYEKSAMKDNLRGMCALAVMYYKGKVKRQNFDEARKLLDYCCERNHRGSFYWLGEMLLDENYKKYDKEEAIKHLNTAAEMGSEKAKRKLEEITGN
jgi:hypothetical protein